MASAILAPRPSSHQFQERHLSLKEPVKIGRAVAKAKSSQTNGIFDCKVLSRNHALIWYENGKFMLQDTRSSNGTYVNNNRLSRGTEESEPYELKSGDILQFGVEVVENSKNVTHGCIIALITLFHEDGSEAVGSHEEIPSGVLSLLTADKNIDAQELWQLSQYLQDALHREQMLENKLVALQRIISNSHAASEETFQGFIQEDKLLSRLETLENQLEIISKDMSDDDIKSELVTLQEDKLQYETSAKETLQKIHSEKVEALKKSNDIERLLSNAEDEVTHYKSSFEKSQEELTELMKKHRERLDEIQELKGKIIEAEKQHEIAEQNSINEQKVLKSQLEEAEQRGSALAVEVESLQAECDFTKKQLESMQERLQNQKEVEDDSLENEDQDKEHPFASDHATLEKDVKNKAAHIQLLKEQLAALQTDLLNEQKKSNTLTEKLKVQTETDVQLTQEKPVSSCIDAEVDATQPDTKTEEVLSLNNLHEKSEELQNILVAIKDSLVAFASLLHEDDTSLNLQCLFWEDFTANNNLDKLNLIEQEKVLSRSLQEAKDLCNIFRDDIKYLGTAVEKLKENTNVEDFDENNHIKDDLICAQKELDAVKQQIVDLGEQLIEEQEVNKKTKMQAATLEKRLLEELWRSNYSQVFYAQVFKQLSEAHKQMEIEELDKSLSYEALKSAIHLADEMRKEASDYAKVAGQERVEIDSLLEENKTMKLKLTRLECEMKKLKQENEFMIKANESRKKTEEDESFQRSYNIVEMSEINDLLKTSDEPNADHLLNRSANQMNCSLDDTLDSYPDVIDGHTPSYQQLTHVIVALLVVIVIFGALVLLGLIDVTPGTLPLLDDRTWIELWEHLF